MTREEQLEAETRELRQMLNTVLLRYKCICIKHGEQPIEDGLIIHKATFMALENQE